MPAPEASGGGGCGALGQILMVVVIVVVAYFTAGAAATALQGAGGVLGASGGAAVGGVGGLSVGTAVTAGAIGGAVGSIAGQVVGNAIGAQDGFDWTGVALGAIGGGVAAGVGGSGLVNTSNAVTNAAVQGAVTNAATQGIAVVAGLQDHFDWRGVAAAAVGSAVGQGVGEGLKGTTAFEALGQNGAAIAKASISGFAAGVTTAAARGGSISVARVATDAFGNALGSSLADAASSPGQTQPSASASGGGSSGSWGDMAPMDYSLASGGPVRFGTGSVETVPTPEELQASFRASEREYRSANDESVAGAGYVARSGDSISRIVGSSDAQAVGNFMRANNLTSDRIEFGRNYFVPGSTTAYGDATDLGQFALNQGNERIAAASRSETQRELNRFAAMSEGSGASWSMRNASAALRLQGGAPAVGSPEWFRTASDAELHANGYQTVSVYDPAVNARAAMEQQRVANNLAAGLGGPFVAAPIFAARAAGLSEYQVEQAGMLGLSAMDAAGVKSGGTATRLASAERRGLTVGGAAGAAELDWTRLSPRTGGTAAEHVVENHGSLSFTKPNQGVFYGDPVETLSDAWRIAQQSGVTPVTVGNRDIYVVPRPNSGYAGSMGGQLENFDHVTLITEAGTTRMVTGYPSGGTPPLPKGYPSLFGSP